MWHGFDHGATVRGTRRRRPSTGDAAAALALTLAAGEGSGGLEYAVSSLAFSPDGQWLAAADAACSVYVYDVDR
jgi:hypothetical protein